MSIKSDFGKQLEAYFSGEMKGADRLVFEGRVESDPMLKSEFEHQNDIVETLKTRRVTELKTRLSNIPVEPTLIGALLQSAVVKPAIYAVSSLAILSGAYLFYSDNTTSEIQLQSIEGKKEFLTASSLKMNKGLEMDFTYVAKKPSISITPFIEKEEIVQIALPHETVVADIAFEVPEMGNDHTVEEFKSPGLALEEAKKIEEVPSMAKLDKIQINTVSSRRFGFHYRIEDNRLFLYGKFNESPYEIIELNTPSSKSLFFYYDGSFYNLNKEAREVTPLTKIEDQRLTQKLDLLKSESSQ